MSSFRKKKTSWKQWKLKILPSKSNGEVQLDQFLLQPNNIDQGGAKGVAIEVTNPRYTRSLGKKVQNS